MAGRVDVARLAGVSPAVVSYVTNGSHPVGAATRARVLAAIEELGYRPNAIARSLATSRSNTLGLLLPDSSNPYFAELSSAIEDAAFAAGYAVLLGNGADERSRERAYVRSFLDYRVDGVIVCPGDDSSHAMEELSSASMPLVVTDRLSQDMAFPAVVVDNTAGSRAATEHLIGHGRRVFACISGSSETSPARDRAAGWEQALTAAGLIVDRSLLLFVDFSVEAGWQATRELLEREHGIDAMFVASDLQAVGALRALADSGRRVGEDVSVVGFDGIRLGDYISPSLTTVAQPFDAIAATVVERLLELINRPATADPAPRILPTRLQIRESCGCTASAPPVGGKTLTITPRRGMNRNRIGLLAATAVLALGLNACSGPSGSPAGESSGDGKFSVAFAVNGPLGDQGFFDDAQRGIKELEKDGHKTQTLQADANNPTQWKSNLESISTGNWDIAVAGTSQVTDIMTATAKKFPDQKFIIFDSVVDAPNVASITYKQNEGSFLAGVLAGLATTDTKSFPLAKGSKSVGVVGGMDIPVINDFVGGYKAGLEAVDPSIKVQVSYVGSFTDSAKGYDQAKAMYANGADVVFQVAGGSGIGVLQAAKDADKYAIGVDSNQNALQKGHVLASMLKNIGSSLVLAVDSAQDGKLKYGSTTSYGLANDGVGLDFDDNGDLVPKDVIKKIDDYKQKVVDGSTKVPSMAG